MFNLPCHAQTAGGKTHYNERFKWTITVPDGFEEVSAAEWERLQNRGEDAIEQTIGDEMINLTKTIFVLRNGNFNYLESNYQPFDPEVDGDYLSSCKLVNEVLYETLRMQMPQANLDSTASVETISGLQFQVFKVEVELPNAVVLRTIMYSRLFDKNEFTVNITYVDGKMGEMMLSALRSSTFD